jgi:hypothetical protein
MARDARVDERTRIARDLHDTLLQSFQGLTLLFQRARNLLPERAPEAIQTLELRGQPGILVSICQIKGGRNKKNSQNYRKREAAD